MMIACACGSVDLLAPEGLEVHGLTACRAQYRMKAWAVAELVELEVEILYPRTPFADSIGREPADSATGADLGRIHVGE